MSKAGKMARTQLWSIFLSYRNQSKNSPCKSIDCFYITQTLVANGLNQYSKSTLKTQEQGNGQPVGAILWTLRKILPFFSCFCCWPWTTCNIISGLMLMIIELWKKKQQLRNKNSAINLLNPALEHKNANKSVCICCLLWWSIGYNARNRVRYHILVSRKNWKGAVLSREEHVLGVICLVFSNVHQPGSKNIAAVYL